LTQTTKESLGRIGSWTALLIGLPVGIIFSITVLYVSMFPPLDYALALIGGKLFWHPIIWGGLIPLSFAFLLWTGGKKIKTHFDKNYSTLKSSFIFTLHVNSRLFGLLLLIFVIGGLFFNIIQDGSFSDISFVAVGLTIFTFIAATVFTTVTIGLLIVTVTKNRITTCRQTFHMDGNL
jgi:hypothetical protein